jgi:hypothetical protein
MKRAEIWRAVAAEHLVKAHATDDAKQAALHMGIASDLHAKALTEEIGDTQHADSAGIDFDRLRTALRQVFMKA